MAEDGAGLGTFDDCLASAGSRPATTRPERGRRGILGCGDGLNRRAAGGGDRHGRASPLSATTWSAPGRPWSPVARGSAAITLFDAAAFPVRIAAEVKDFDAAAIFGGRRARHLDRFVQFALAATGEAIEASKLDVAADPWRVGVVYGTGIGGLAPSRTASASCDSRGPEWVNPYTCPMMIPNMAAGQIAMEWKIHGYNSCTVTACAASTQAIGEAFDLIRLGRADAVVCGGSEAPVNRVGVAGFAAMKALSASHNDDPERASRPFDAGRDGFVVGEGAATLILEERESALRRGATDPRRAGRLRRHVRRPPHDRPPPGGRPAPCGPCGPACDDAGISPAEIGYINAHGTSTAAQRPDRDAGRRAGSSAATLRHCHRPSP